MNIIKDQSRCICHLCRGAWRKEQARKHTAESCARPRMQLGVMATMMALVVMVTMTALVGAKCGLKQCRPVNISVEVESCGVKQEVVTTVCVGHCYHQDPVYTGYVHSPGQGVCVGDWHYEEWLIQDCPVPATFLRARSCSCGPCDTQHVDCEPFSHDLPSCMPS